MQPVNAIHKMQIVEKICLPVAVFLVGRWEDLPDLIGYVITQLGIQREIWYKIINWIIIK